MLKQQKPNNALFFRSDHQFVSYRYLIFSNFSELLPPPKKESESGPVMSVTYLGLVLILSTKFHPDLSALSVFQDFRPPPPNDTGPGRDKK